ncbi:MAG: L,D-transpeptidase [Gammaproteobacteria bacterium]
MKKWMFSGLIITMLLPAYTQAASYGQRLCRSDADVTCIRIHPDDTWYSLWPDPEQRDLIMRLNRRNTPLRPGEVIAIPNRATSAMALSPMEPSIAPPGKTTIIVDPKQLAWGAYDSDGQLVKWGPAAAGKSYCPDEGRACRSPTGTFTVLNKQGSECISSKFPVPKGGAPMPYCMYFHGGYALHGSELPGTNASHGCIRMFNEDAEWLNHEFVKVGSTQVIVEPYYS